MQSRYCSPTCSGYQKIRTSLKFCNIFRRSQRHKQSIHCPHLFRVQCINKVPQRLWKIVDTTSHGMSLHSPTHMLDTPPRILYLCHHQNPFLTSHNFYKRRKQVSSIPQRRRKININYQTNSLVYSFVPLPTYTTDLLYYYNTNLYRASPDRPTAVLHPNRCDET